MNNEGANGKDETCFIMRKQLKVSWHKNTMEMNFSFDI